MAVDRWDTISLGGRRYPVIAEVCYCDGCLAERRWQRAGIDPYRVVIEIAEALFGWLRQYE